MVSSVIITLIIIFIFVLVECGIIVFVAYYYHKKNQEFGGVPANAVLVLSFDKDGTHGHMIGYELKIKHKALDNPPRITTTFKPIDVERNADGIPKEDLLPFDVTLPVSRRIPCSKGVLSDELNAAIYLPESVDKIPDALYNTIIGKAIRNLTDAAVKSDDILKISVDTSQALREDFEVMNSSKVRAEMLSKVKETLSQPTATTRPAIKKEEEKSKNEN